MDKAYEGFLHSQFLWRGEAFGITQFELPDSLLCELAARLDKSLPDVKVKRRLGHQAEFVFLQLLVASSEYEVLGHSMQLIDQKKTLGELDYLVRKESTQEVIHIELTYKFYLLDNSIIDPLDRLVGPNRKDTFIAKLKKTREKQMPLLYSVPSRHILGELGIEVDKIVQRVAFYGHVFIPYGSRSINIDGLNEDCNDGYWMNRDQFEKEEFGTCTYYQPQKYEWLHIPHLNVQWKVYQEIQEEIKKSLDVSKSPMLWMRREDQSILKIFVTP